MAKSASSASSAVARIGKATNDALNGPDWAINMDICDSINSGQWQAKDVVKTVKKRLQNKNAKVQLLALTLLEAMVKNCGDIVHSQVVEQEVLQDMVKIVKRKADMQIRDKILVLLDSWQDAFGGPEGRYPQYYSAYAELQRSGVAFPPRSVDSALLFSEPITHPSHTSLAAYGMPSNPSTSLDEEIASGMGNLSLSDFDSIRRAMVLLNEMLRAVNPNDGKALKDEVITDLVAQCRSNQKRLLHLVNSTVDEQLLGEGLSLNDSIQNLLSKYDAIVSGAPLPSEPSNYIGSTTPVVSKHVPDSRSQDEKDNNDDDVFSQLARRNSNLLTFQAPVPQDSPSAIRTSSKEQEMIDLLTLNLSTSSETSHALSTPPPASRDKGSPPPAVRTVQVAKDQGVNPDNKYNTSRAKPTVAQPPVTQPPPQPVQAAQPQVHQFSPPQQPPPSQTSPPSSSTSANLFPSSDAKSATSTPSNSLSGGETPPPLAVESTAKKHHTTTIPETSKPYIPYKLFADLIELRYHDASLNV